MSKEPEYPPTDPDFPLKPEHGAATKIIEFRCLKCGQWDRSPFFFDGELSFDAGTMEGCKAGCRNCGELVPCNKENMRVRFENGGGFKGNETV